MSEVQGSAGKNEPDPPERSGYTKEAIGEVFIQVAAIIGVTVGIFLVKLYRDEDGVRLQALHGTLRMLQTGARLLGEAAIKVESAYNETASRY